jgi:CRP-like cAMP-binding protein
MDDDTRGGYDGGNHLIDELRAADRREVIAHLTTIVAEEASGGISRGERIAAVYFPIDSVFSVLVELNGGDCYEADSVGREGLVGGELLLGVATASRSIICQIGGRVAQMPVDAFERCVEQIPAFSAAARSALLMQWYRAQQTIACNFAHTLVERCARWTLLTYDAIGRPEFTFRAEYLAMMLGVQTNVVMDPMAVLEALAAIRYTGSSVTISSLPRLRESACECYTAPIQFRKRLQSRKPVQREAP